MLNQPFNKHGIPLILHLIGSVCTRILTCNHYSGISFFFFFTFIHCFTLTLHLILTHFPYCLCARCCALPLVVIVGPMGGAILDSQPCHLAVVGRITDDHCLSFQYDTNHNSNVSQGEFSTYLVILLVLEFVHCWFAAVRVAHLCVVESQDFRQCHLCSDLYRC